LLRGGKEYRAVMVTGKESLDQKHWTRAMRALKADKRHAFDRAARACGFFTSSLDAMWKEARLRVNL
jgi:hypothetical protein